MEILPGQKPYTSLRYIIDYLNDVKECGIVPNNSVIVFTKSLFIKIFGTQEYLDEYKKHMNDIGLKTKNHFKKIAIVENESPDTYLIAIYEEEK